MPRIRRLCALQPVALNIPQGIAGANHRIARLTDPRTVRTRRRQLIDFVL
jgi:hypothetical protein